MKDYNNISNARLEFMKTLLVEIHSDDTKDVVDQKTRSNIIADQMISNIQLSMDLLECPYYNGSSWD